MTHFLCTLTRLGMYAYINLIKCPYIQTPKEITIDGI